MINVGQVVFNAMWITGCAVILATFSHAHWLAHKRHNSIWQLLGTPTHRLSVLVGLGLITVGLFFLSQGWLEHVVWSTFCVIFARQIWRLRSGYGS
jgi:hypothetical protein